MRDARKMLVELHGEGGLPNFGDTYRNEQNGQDYPCYRLPKRELMVLVTGYSVAMRAALVDRAARPVSSASQKQSQ
ncbi:Rha family transcriptional regulator [Methylobacterium sp. E-065]|nr:Rha family transcriptional regulator [Methylobacterium sp. E-065]